jgi:uncharacterized protein
MTRPQTLPRRALLGLAAASLLLAAMPASLAAEDPYEDLLIALKNENLPAIRKLVNRGMEIDTVDSAGSTLLMLASRGGNQEIVAYLIASGAKVNHRNAYGDTALMWAALAGNLPVCRMLVEHGAEYDTEGWTPLIYAASKGHDAVVDYLLSLDVDIDATSENGTTALMMAAQAGRITTVKLLLQHKADVNVKNQSGLTAMAWAQARKNTDIVKLLKAAGATQ